MVRTLRNSPRHLGVVENMVSGCGWRRCEGGDKVGWHSTVGRLGVGNRSGKMNDP